MFNFQQYPLGQQLVDIGSIVVIVLIAGLAIYFTLRDEFDCFKKGGAK